MTTKKVAKMSSKLIKVEKKSGYIILPDKQPNPKPKQSKHKRK